MYIGYKSESPYGCTTCKTEMNAVGPVYPWCVAFESSHAMSVIWGAYKQRKMKKRTIQAK
jgi:hypothetical protein